MKRKAGTKVQKRETVDWIDLLDGVKTIHHLFFFEDILIIQILKGQHCKVIVQIFFTPKGMLILEYSKEL